MSDIGDFIKQNVLSILIIVFVVLGLLVVINLKGINLNASGPPTHLIQEVTVETFAEKRLDDSEENIEQLKLQPSESFCQSYLGNSAELEPACNRLTESNCAETSCCVFLKSGNNGKCVAGSVNGPTYRTDSNGNLITMDSYYYLGVRH